MKRWYVAHTRALEEVKAQFHLRRQGFDVYLPQYKKTVRHARKETEKSTPLFPRYIFISMDLAASQWYRILSTIGISHLICNGGLPVAVPSGVVDEIATREDASGFISVPKLPALKKGDKLRIDSGPFKEFIGIFEQENDENRVTLLLELMGRAVRVKVPTAAVQAAS